MSHNSFKETKPSKHLQTSLQLIQNSQHIYNHTLVTSRLLKNTKAPFCDHYECTNIVCTMSLSNSQTSVPSSPSSSNRGPFGSDGLFFFGFGGGRGGIFPLLEGSESYNESLIDESYPTPLVMNGD